MQKLNPHENNRLYGILEEKEDTRLTPWKDEGLYRGTPSTVMQVRTIFLWLTILMYIYLINFLG